MSFLEVTLQLLDGFKVTLILFLITLAGALPLGLVIAFGSMSKFKPLRYLTRGLVWVIRGTPLMLQVILVFYGPGLIFGVQGLDRFPAVVVAFIVNYAAYFSEIYRGGIESIPAGQYEAGQVLGMTKTQIFFRVVLFQVFKRILPPMGNEIITLVKDTSLSRIIALQELIWAGNAFTKGSQGISGEIWPLFFTGFYYLVFSGVLTLLLGALERKLDYFRA